MNKLPDHMTAAYQRLRELREQFRVAHRTGMEALEAGDYAGFGTALEQERAILEEQKRVLAQLRGDALADGSDR